MHVFIRTFKLKIYFLEFSGLFYYSVIKVLRSFPERLCLFHQGFFVAALCVSDLFSLSHSNELVNNFFCFLFSFFDTPLRVSEIYLIIYIRFCQHFFSNFFIVFNQDQ